MPKKPKRPCAYPGCPNLSDETYCEQHRAQARRSYDKYSRSPDVNKIYGRRWRKIRELYIQAHPLCENCLKENKLVPAKEVHHIIPVNRGGSHSFDNLMALCHSCHEKLEIQIGNR